MPGQLAKWRIAERGWLQTRRDTERAGHSLSTSPSTTSLLHQLATGARHYEPIEIVDVNKGVTISSLTDPDDNTITLIGNFRESY